jgi:hypothetical protein
MECPGEAYSLLAHSAMRDGLQEEDICESQGYGLHTPVDVGLESIG